MVRTSSLRASRRRIGPHRRSHSHFSIEEERGYKQDLLAIRTECFGSKYEWSGPVEFPHVAGMPCLLLPISKHDHQIPNIEIACKPPANEYLSHGKDKHEALQRNIIESEIEREIKQVL